MALTPGVRLGAYELGAMLGAGGMGEVYRARDTRLGREVAIKILPPLASSDPDRRRRFEQEARAASALNHPHICVIHDVGRDAPRPAPGGGGPAHATGASEPVDFLVMELLEGQTLARRLHKGRLPLDQALEVGAQVAEALAAAHRHGIVHRDVKPANVMLTREGVKLLDFGLAKLKVPILAAAGGASALSTEAPATVPGAVLGTIPYMAPEQLEGREADARADVFALGCVLHEMLTGRRAFPGETEASVISAIMSGEPAPLSSLQPLTPPALDHVVGRCLAKDPEQRYDSARDLADQLRWIREAAHRTDSGQEAGGGRWRWVAAAAGLALIVAAIGAGSAFLTPWRPASSPGRAAVVRSFVDVAPAEGLAPFSRGRPRSTAVALSPDGRTLVFAATRDGRVLLYRRLLDQAEAVPIADTEGAEGPFFSPDGRWIGFWAEPGLTRGTYRSLVKVPASGGAATPICRVDENGVAPSGASWGDDGYVVFAAIGRGFQRVHADGGVPADVPGPAPGVAVRVQLPHVLPGSRALLAQERPAGQLYFDPDRSRIVVQELPGGTRRTLVEAAADPRFLSSGHLLFARWGRLYAVPFDVKSLAVRGAAVAVLDGVMQAQNSTDGLHETAAAQAAVSTSGTLAYVPGGVMPDVADRRLVWRDRNGRREAAAAPPGDFGFPRLSPDGRRVAFRRLDRGKASIWTYDFARATLTRLTHQGWANYPLWTPDGSRILVSYATGEETGVAWIPADGSASPAWVCKSRYWLIPHAVTPDGRTLVAAEIPTEDPNTFVLLSLSEGGSAAPRPWRDAPGPTDLDLNEPELSPDGRWLAYTTAETGRPEVYVEALAARGSRQQVSRNRARNPRWSPDGRTLFYVDLSSSGDQQMMAVEVRASDTLTLGASRPLFRGTWVVNTRTSFDVAPDGSRFLLVEPDPQPSPSPPARIHLVQGWLEEVKAKVPR